jgi:hypothetical protein
MLAQLRRITVLGLLLSLLASNVLTLTSFGFNAALSGVLAGTLGVRTVTDTLSQRLRSTETRLAKASATQRQRQAAARRFGQSLVARSRRVAARSIAAIPAESLPYVGVAAIIAGTGYELYAMCQTLTDLDRLYRELGVAESVPEDTLSALCTPQRLFQDDTP